MLLALRGSGFCLAHLQLALSQGHREAQAEAWEEGADAPALPSNPRLHYTRSWFLQSQGKAGNSNLTAVFSHVQEV